MYFSLNIVEATIVAKNNGKIYKESKRNIWNGNRIILVIYIIFL